MPDTAYPEAQLLRDASRSNVWELEPGDAVRRKELHDRCGGSRQGGIAPSREAPNVLISRVHGPVVTTGTSTTAGTNSTRPSDIRAKVSRAISKWSPGTVRSMSMRHRAEHSASSRVFEALCSTWASSSSIRIPTKSDGRLLLVAEQIAMFLSAASVQSKLRCNALAKQTVSTVAPFLARRRARSSRDPNQLDRALQAHADVQNGLYDYLAGRGIAAWSSRPDEPDFDIAWIHAGVTFVAEVKSLSNDNEDRQLRLALGQVLDYQELMAARYANVRAVIAIER